jgi:hypothetical protein
MLQSSAAANWKNNGMPADKIVIGMPAYGQSWYVTSQGASIPPLGTPGVKAGSVCCLLHGKFLFLYRMTHAHVLNCPAVLHIKHVSFHNSRYLATFQCKLNSLTQKPKANTTCIINLVKIVHMVIHLLVYNRFSTETCVKIEIGCRTRLWILMLECLIRFLKVFGYHMITKNPLLKK